MTWGIPKAVIFCAIFLVLNISVGFFVWKGYSTFENIVVGIQKAEASQTALFLDRTEDQFDGASVAVFARTALEIDTTNARHKRSTSALISRTWLRFTSACFGAILISIGALFVLGQVTAGTTKADVNWSEAKVSLVVSSPGLLLAVLGSILMITPNVVQQSITADDTASFFEKSGAYRDQIAEIEEKSSQALRDFCASNPEAQSCEKVGEDN